MSGIIVYRSSTGSTKEYADWIAEETGFSAHDSKNASIRWESIDTIVVGCPVIALKPALGGWIKKNWDQMKDKRVVLFTTSGADPANEPVQEWIDKSLPESIRSQIRTFPLPGRFDYARLKGISKALIWFAGKVLGNRDIKNQIENPVDGVAKENLTPLLDYLRQP